MNDDADPTPRSSEESASAAASSRAPLPRFYQDLETFRRATGVYERLRTSGALRVLIGSGGYPPAMQIEIQQYHPELLAVVDEGQVTLEDLQTFSYDLVDALIFSAIGGTEAEFVSWRADPERFEDGEIEPADVAAQKWALAQETVDLVELQRRIWLKRSSKTPVPTRFDWEVAEKRATDGEPPPDGAPVPFAAVRFSAVTPDRDGVSWPPTELSLTLDLEDVQYLHDSLGRLRAALESTDTGG